MNEQNGENIKDLFERFVGTEEAQSCVEDFDKVKRILDENPAPKPSQELIAAINSRIAEEIRLRKEHSFRRLAYRLAPVAAVFVVLAAVGVRMMLKESSGPAERVRRPIIPTSDSVWESEKIAAVDRNLLVLTTELDELEVEFANLESDDIGGNGSSAITELEIELEGIDTDIWEG